MLTRTRKVDLAVELTLLFLGETCGGLWGICVIGVFVHFGRFLENREVQVLGGVQGDSHFFDGGVGTKFTGGGRGGE